MATRAAWIERVRRYEQSGLDLADFARAEGLELSQLEWWCRVLRASEPQRAELRSLATEVATPCPPLAAPAWVDVVLPNGDLVRLMPGTDAATLACVLAAAAELGSGRPRSR